MAAIAIPLMALGGMYIMQNQKKTRTEGLTNMTQVRNPLPGVTPPIASVNYPVTAPVSTQNVKYYANPHQTTDKFFDKKNYDMVDADASGQYGIGGGAKEIYSLTGTPVEKSKFKHNNMVPFFGAKIRGATADRNVTESVLDNMQGAGSQQFKKQEQAPMFQPQQGYQFANGAPNMSDFYQSRVNPSLKISNVLPWEQQQVAPGLDWGYGTQGANGYNAGTLARDKWIDKTVNELRVDTNPKITFGLFGHEGPADAYIKNSGSQETQGKVEKYRPDAYFVQSPDRWLTTTGQEKAPKSRSEEIMQDVNRLTTTAEYYGATGQQVDSTYIVGEYDEPKRQVIKENDYKAPPGAQGRSSPTVADYGALSYSNLPNHRTTCSSQGTGNYGAINGFIKAVVSPLMDIMRPSRKENLVNCMRSSGNPMVSVGAGQINMPGDRTKTTSREMTEGLIGLNHLNMENQKSDGYLVTDYQPTLQQRDTTNTNYSGVATPNGAYNVTRSYEAEYMQRNNPNKTFLNHPNQGGMALLSNEENINVKRNDCDRNNNRWWVRSSGNSAGITAPPAQETFGNEKVSFVYDDAKFNKERINPDILNAFKSNPYTQSLSSYAYT